jgi:hypothetical protein
MARSTRFDDALSVDDLTKINLQTLGRVLKEEADADGVFSRMPAVAVPHIKRCVRAGIVVPAGKAGYWKVTPDGYVMLRAYKYI